MPTLAAILASIPSAPIIKEPTFIKATPNKTIMVPTATRANAVFPISFIAEAKLLSKSLHIGFFLRSSIASKNLTAPTAIAAATPPITPMSLAISIPTDASNPVMLKIIPTRATIPAPRPIMPIPNAASAPAVIKSCLVSSLLLSIRDLKFGSSFSFFICSKNAIAAIPIAVATAATTDIVFATSIAVAVSNPVNLSI